MELEYFRCLIDIIVRDTIASPQDALQQQQQHAPSSQKQFKIEIIYIPLNRSCEISRTEADISRLLNDMSGYNEVLSNTHEHLSISTAFDRETVETALKTVVSELGEEIFNYEAFLRFVNGSNSASDGQQQPLKFEAAHVDHLSHKVKALSGRVESIEEMMLQLKDSNSYLLNVVRQLQLQQQKQVYNSSTSLLSNSGKADDDTATVERVVEYLGDASVDAANADVDDADDVVIAAAVAGSAMQSSVTALDGSAHSTLSSNGTEGDGSISALDRELRFVTNDISAAAAAALTDPDAAITDPAAAASTTAVVAASSFPIITEEELFNAPDFYAAAIDSIVRVFQPNSNSTNYLASVTALVRRQVRISLGSSCFTTALHRIGSSLPDDTLVFTAVMCKSVMANWHSTLSDRLMLIANNGGDASIFVEAEEDEAMLHLPDSHSPQQRHIISNVSHSKINMFKVHFQVDGKDVEVVANNRADLCFLLFLEEVNKLVGKDELFKRSLLLIRAWWSYETAAYVGTPIKHYLPDLAVCVMAAAVFNIHHKRISSPLQALCLFLSEYAAFNGETHAITLQGIVPFKSATSNQPAVKTAATAAATTVATSATTSATAVAGTSTAAATTAPAADSHHLIADELVEKYWHMVNINYTPADPNQLDYYQRLNSSSEDVSGENYQSKRSPHISPATATATLTIANVAATPSTAAAANAAVAAASGDDNSVAATTSSAATATVLSAEKAQMRSLSLHNLFYFERHSFSVVYPFSHNNMITEKLSSRRQMRLSKAFQIGASKLQVYLKPQHDANSNVNDIFNYFPGTVTKFGASLRQAAAATEADIARNTFFSDEEQLYKNLMYSNIMLESVVTEQALLMLSVEILATKGALPVGEIGKILAEVTSIASFSQKLKEKFGGLKKFLENFPNKFVISNDHPFNPNVLLRESLSAEHLELIDRGIFPHQLLLKTKKGSSSSKKKKNSNTYESTGYKTDYSSVSSVNSPYSSYQQMQQLPQRFHGALNSSPASALAAMNYNSAASFNRQPQMQLPATLNAAAAAHSSSGGGKLMRGGLTPSPPFDVRQQQQMSPSSQQQQQYLLLQRQREQQMQQRAYNTNSQYHPQPQLQSQSLLTTSPISNNNSNNSMSPNPYARSPVPPGLAPNQLMQLQQQQQQEKRPSPNFGVAELVRQPTEIIADAASVSSIFGTAGSSSHSNNHSSGSSVLSGLGRVSSQRALPMPPPAGSSSGGGYRSDPFSARTGVDYYQDLILNSSSNNNSNSFNDRNVPDSLTGEPPSSDIMYNLRQGSVEVRAAPSTAGGASAAYNYSFDAAGSTRQRLAGAMSGNNNSNMSSNSSNSSFQDYTPLFQRGISTNNSTTVATSAAGGGGRNDGADDAYAALSINLNSITVSPPQADLRVSSPGRQLQQQQQPPFGFGQDYRPRF